jgi:F-type H+-transporting ATPase subunit delta
MIISATARRYAKALSDVAGESGSREVIRKELELLASVLAEHTELAAVLRNPAIPAEKKSAIVKAVLEMAHLKLSPLTGNLIGLLIANRRTSLLEQILAAYQQELDASSNIVAAELVTRSELGQDRRTLLASRLEQALGKRMRLEFEHDESLIGGAILKIGSTVYDGSIRRQLEEIRSRMAGGN